MKLRRLKQPGEIPPRGYGFAWRDFESGSAVCYPVPLNWLARWLRDCYFFLARGPRYRQFEQAYAVQIRQAYARGLEVGWRTRGQREPPPSTEEEYRQCWIGRGTPPE